MGQLTRKRERQPKPQKRKSRDFKDNANSPLWVLALSPSAWPRGSPCTMQPRNKVNVNLRELRPRFFYFRYLFCLFYRDSMASSAATQWPGCGECNLFKRFHVGLTLVTYSCHSFSFARILFHTEEWCRSQSKSCRYPYPCKTYCNVELFAWLSMSRIK